MYKMITGQVILDKKEREEISHFLNDTLDLLEWDSDKMAVFLKVRARKLLDQFEGRGIA